jgi:hypothetical protein
MDAERLAMIDALAQQQNQTLLRFTGMELHMYLKNEHR